MVDYRPECFFTNRECPYFPCHEGIDERDFNCMFCYCPLYALGEDCGGDYRFLDNGVKDCSDCTRLHVGDSGGDLVAERFGELSAIILGNRKRRPGPREEG